MSACPFGCDGSGVVRFGEPDEDRCACVKRDTIPTSPCERGLCDGSGWLAPLRGSLHEDAGIDTRCPCGVAR